MRARSWQVVTAKAGTLVAIDFHLLVAIDCHLWSAVDPPILVASAVNFGCLLPVVVVVAVAAEGWRRKSDYYSNVTAECLRGQMLQWRR